MSSVGNLLIDWLIECLAGLIDWLINWMFRCLSVGEGRKGKSMINWFIDWLADWLIDWLIE